MRRIISLLLCAAAILFVAPLFSCNETTALNSCYLDLFYDSEAGIISGKAAYKFVNSSNEMLNKIKFNLYPNAYSEKNKAFFEGYKDAYYQGESFGGIKILSCSSGEKSLDFSVSEDELTLEVLCDGVDYEKQSFYGRAYCSAPEIDGKVYFTYAGEIRQGEYYNVKIKKADAYDLYGEATEA